MAEWPGWLFVGGSDRRLVDNEHHMIENHPAVRRALADACEKTSGDIDLRTDIVPPVLQELSALQSSAVFLS